MDEKLYDEKLGRAEDRLTGKIEAVNDKIEAVKTELTGKIEAVNDKIEAVKTELTGKIEAVDAKVMTLDKTLNEFRAEIRAENKEFRAEIKADNRETRASFRNNMIAAVTLSVTIMFGTLGMMSILNQRNAPAESFPRPRATQYQTAAPIERPAVAEGAAASADVTAPR
ncbi:MAG: hypothetical protein LBR38_07750 [Synergistaceae bacterium]|jgi:phage host-nuclease inhibitor protein Gam|nr:hypothetical protein [Synergistaceae bacterium]